MATPRHGAANTSRDAQAVFDALFFSTAGRTNPYPLYDELRVMAPVFRSTSDLGVWVLPRYDDCWTTLRDPRFGTDYTRQIGPRPPAAPPSHTWSPARSPASDCARWSPATPWRATGC